MANRESQQRASPESIPPVVDGDALVGRELDGRYRIDAAVAVGGMGAVYRATHLTLGSQVAIKLLLDQHASSAALRKRFEREAKALAGLAHPSIVSVTDYGVSGDIPYLVMELLEGEPLSRRLPRAPFPPSQAHELVEQLLRALSYVHERGLVHRDLKPGNVFLQRLPDGEERVKLLDFGLAKFMQGAPASADQHLTPVGEAVGTPAYMPPEQIAGGPADARTDVYAVGVILFQMLCGRLPFEGEPMEQLKSHLLAPVPALGQKHPNGRARPELDALLERAMAKKPDARFQDAAEMLAALEAIPQPWILARDADPAEASDALGAASTLLDPRLAEAVPSGQRATVDSRPAPTSRGRTVWTILLVTAAASAGLYAIAKKPSKHESAAEERATAQSAPTPPEPIAKSAPSAPAPAATGETPAPAPAAASETPAPTTSATPPAPETAPTPAQPVAPPTEAAAAHVETPKKASAPRPAARDPWIHGTPKELRSLRKLVANGGFGSDRAMAALRKYSHDYPDDPRGHLVLARLFVNRHWRADAVSQYAAAYQLDPSARGAPQMLSDLLGLVAQGSNADDAARLVQKAYGKEALGAIDRALASTRSSSAASKRLHSLRSRITGP